jgi:phage-related protein
MPTRSYDLKLAVANSTGFVKGNTILGNTSSTSALIMAVEPNILKVKLNNVLQEFSSSEAIHSNSVTLAGSTAGQKNNGLVPFISNTVVSETTTASTTITSIEFNRFTSAKNADTQNPIVRLLSVYFPGEWYPPNENGNPTNDGEGRAWPNGFPIQFAQVVGATNEDIAYTVIYDNKSYTPAPVNISGIDQSADGKINELSLEIFNVGNIISSLIENPYISGNNISNSVVAQVNGEFVHGIDPRTVDANPSDVGSAGSEAFDTLTRARANGLSYDATVVSDVYGMSNASFTFDQTKAVNGQWRNSTFDSRDLLGAAVNIKTTFAQFLDYWPEYSVITNISANSPQQLASKYSGTQWFSVEPQTVFTDNAGAVSASFGEPVAALRVPGGPIIATQTSMASRPIYGRHPESGIRNRIQNNSSDGAVVGVVGSGGSFPTNWTRFTVTAEVLDIQADWLDIRFTGSNVGSGIGIYLHSTTAARIPATAGQVWTSSFGLALIGGDLTNVTALRQDVRSVTAADAFAHNASGPSISPTSVLTRYTYSPTLVNQFDTVEFVSNRLVINAATGPVDFTLRISRPQLELAGTASAVQNTRAGGFDITEAGQRSVYYLQPDGIDDWMALSTPFVPASTYTVATAMALITGSFEPFAGTSGAGSARYVVGFANNGQADYRYTGGTANQLRYRSTDLVQRNVQVLRTVSASQIDVYVNGIVPTIISTGTPIPSGGHSRLFRFSETYTTGRFYAGVLIPSAITEQERLDLQDYLTERVESPPELEWFVRVKNSSVYRTGDNVISTTGSIEGTILAIDANNTIYLSNVLDVGTQVNQPLYIVNPEADTESFIEDTFKIEQLESLTEDVATFGLVSWLQYFKAVLPKRRFYKNTCQWRYKGPECQYPESGTGTIPGTSPAVSANGFFTINNVSTTDPNDDVCSKSFAACSLRRNTVHFGGFPGTGRQVPRV